VFEESNALFFDAVGLIGEDGLGKFVEQDLGRLPDVWGAEKSPESSAPNHDTGGNTTHQRMFLGPDAEKVEWLRPLRRGELDSCGGESGYGCGQDIAQPAELVDFVFARVRSH
jgi:hypothetical protein